MNRTFNYHFGMGNFIFRDTFSEFQFKKILNGEIRKDVFGQMRDGTTYMDYMKGKKN